MSLRLHYPSWSRPERAFSLDTLWILLCTLILATEGIRDNVLGIAWPQIGKEFNEPIDAIGVLLVAFAAAYLAASIGTGLLVGRWGSRRVIPVAAVIAATALATGSAATNWSALVLCLFLGGAASGAMDSALNAHVALSWGPRTMNALHAGYATGAVSGPVLFAAVTDGNFRWRAFYASLALVMGGLASMLAAGRWRTPSEASTETSLPKGAVYALAKGPTLWRLVLFLVYSGLELSIGIWIFTLFTTGRGYGQFEGAATVSLFWGGVITARVALSAWPRPVVPGRIVRVALASLAASLALLSVGWSILSDVAAVIAAGLSAGPVFPSLMSDTIKYAGRDHATSAVAWQTASATIGQALVPASIGMAARNFGVHSIPIAFVAYAIGIVALNSVFEHRRGSKDGTCV